MKRTGIEKKTRTSIMIIIILMVCTSVITYYLVLNVFKYNKNISTMNTARVLTNEVMSYIEENYENISKDISSVIKNENSASKSTYDKFSEVIQNEINKINSKISIIDNNGRIVFHSENKNILKDKVIVNIKETINYDMSFQSENPKYVRFSLPIVVGNKHIADSVFQMPYDEIIKDKPSRYILYSFIPLIIGLILIVIIMLYLKLRISKDILNPLKELNKAADEISKGNLENKIKYNDSTELSKFCGNFEFMRDELKNSMEQQEKLTKAHKELIACISHDLRTPIASIKAYVDGIQDGIANDPIRLEKYLSVIGRKTESLSKLIEDLFQYSQTELGELKINMKEQYSGSLLNRIIHPIKIELNKSSVNFYVDEDIPNVLVNVDSLRIEQVIMNLIQNAKKYTADGGSIYFSTAVEERYLKIIIRDTGIGISPEDLLMIFDRFYRGEKSRSRDYGGAGLGLAICKHIVEAHGGEIYAESVLDKGSTFYFTIPKA